MPVRKTSGSVLIILICLVATSSCQFAVAGPKGRIKYNFNSGWKVLTADSSRASDEDFDDRTWVDVTLPYGWNDGEAFRKDIHDLSTGIAWYRKHFKVPASSKGKKVFLEFEGIRHGGEFYLNGKYIGIHENGAMSFGFDISDWVRVGNEDNVLAVRIDNDWRYKEKSSGSRFQWNDSNFNANYGGIPKNVFLHITDRLYQTLPLYSVLKTKGVYVYADNYDIPGKSATIHIEAEIRNEYATTKAFEFEAIVKDVGGKIITKMPSIAVTISAGETKTVAINARVKGLEFWSWGYGYLYHIHSIIKVEGKPIDLVTTVTGFRKTSFSNGMIALNDRVIMMKGYAQRTSNEWPAVGISIPPWLSDYSNQLMVESNANLVRWMHITPRKQDVESCDRVGLLQAMPAGDAERDATGRQWDQRKELMRDAIVLNRNNPSIVFYECGNEEISEEHMKEMKAIRDQYDPHGGRAIGSREMLNSTTAEYGGEMLYINKSADIPMWAMEYSRDEGLRKYWDEFSPPYHRDGVGPPYKNADASAYNRNQDSHAIENIRRWFDYWTERPGTGKRVSAGGVNIIFSDSNTHFRGNENYRRSGEVDAMRIPKDGFYAHQVMWDGWVDVEKPRIHLVGHWNYADSVVKDVFVISSAEKVQLFINDALVGEGKQQYRFLYTFKNIKWQTGTIRAVGYDRKGNQVCETAKNTIGAPVALRLKAITAPNGMKADGADVSLVEVEVVDGSGQRCPTALNVVNFSMEGEGVWKGGIAQGPDNYIMAKSLPVECGVNRVLIRSTTKAGRIIITATAEGLTPAQVTLTTAPIRTEHGLSLVLPDDGLRGNLKRGPTPSGPSYHMVRTPVGIREIVAGSNVQSTGKMVDDDETTSWKSENSHDQAWARFTLDREATISEITMKLGEWRSREYPIRILVDSVVVFDANTQRNLGYYTATFPPTKGKTVSIELAGANANRDGFDNIVEVTGKKLTSGDSGSDTHSLELIEIEIYEGTDHPDIK